MTRIRRSGSTTALPSHTRIGSYEVWSCYLGGREVRKLPAGATLVGPIEKVLEYRPLHQLPLPTDQPRVAWLPEGWPNVEIRSVAPSPGGPVEYRQVLTPGTNHDQASAWPMAPPAARHDKAAASTAKSAQQPPARQPQREPPRTLQTGRKEEELYYRVRRNGSVPDVTSYTRAEDLDEPPKSKYGRGRQAHKHQDASATFPYSHASRHQQTTASHQLAASHYGHHQHSPQQQQQQQQQRQHHSKTPTAVEARPLEPPKEFSNRRNAALQRELQRELELKLKNRKRSRSVSSVARDSGGPPPEQHYDPSPSVSGQP